METGWPVVWFPESRMRMRRGSRAAGRQPRSAAGVGAPATHSLPPPREGLGLRGWRGGEGGVGPRIGTRGGG